MIASNLFFCSLMILAFLHAVPKQGPWNAGERSLFCEYKWIVYIETIILVLVLLLVGCGSLSSLVPACNSIVLCLKKVKPSVVLETQ